MTNKKQNNFQTQDLGCAAALISCGLAMVGFDKSDPRKVLFIFEQDENLGETLNKYWADKLLVNPRTLFNNIKMLKNRIYSE